MSFLLKFFGKSKKNLPENLSLSTPAEKPLPEPARGGTTLRKQEDAPPERKAGPELSALEMAERQSWEVKRLPVWGKGDEILGLYRVEDVLEGGMGRVYIAHHKSWNVKLAIKAPNEMMLSDRNNFARVLREANSWTELGLHPNIAYCYYVRSIEDVPHIFVEYVDGGNLEQWIEDGKCIDYRLSLDLAIQFCHGMEHAHSKGMVHRDIKPKNILMTKDGILKITDFGLVRIGAAIGGEKDKAGVSGKGMTRLGDVMGTEGYMAPEQFTDAAGVDERADIFSFGVCLYEMCCGARPYDITIGERKEAPDPVKVSRDAKFPPALSEVLKKCVQWERDRRYGAFKEVREQLSTIYRDLFNQESPYAEMELVDLEADSLNNRGVSYFELGRKEEARSCWEQAISLNRAHLEATYNHGLILWRDAKIADDELLRRLENCGNNPSADKQKLAEFKAFIHSERSDFDAAREVLKEYPGWFDALFPAKDIPMEASVSTLQGHTSSVHSVAVSPDGRHIVSGSGDKTLRVWELGTGRCIHTLQGHKGGSIQSP
jgi:serine/threonine protein kinase